jgi:transcriptional regulator with XRE-family HTH domain
MQGTFDTKAVCRLIVLSRQAIGMSQGELASMMHIARRTVGRWEARQSHPSFEQLADLARAVHPRDAGLAQEIATETGTTLEALGLGAKSPAPTPEPAKASAPPPRRFPPVDLMTDSIVFVARQALEENAGQETMASLLAVLRAAFARAKGLGLTVDEVDLALSSPRGPAVVKAIDAAAKKVDKRG